MADQQRPIRVRVEGHGIVEFPAGTSEQEMAAALTQLTEPQNPNSKEAVIARARGPVAEFGIGVLKGGKRTLGNLASAAVSMFPGVNYTPADQARIEQQSTPEGGWQKAGYAAETIAEMAVPGVPITRAGVRAIPSQKRAGEAFQRVMGAAKNVPVDITEPGNQALRIYQLSERGGSMPKAVRDFLKRVTDPEKAPMTYEEARDFASNISRLSADEYKRIPPAMQKEIHGLRIALNRAVGQAASKVGKGDEYAGAMKEYAQRARVNETAKNVKKEVRRYIVPASLTTAGLTYLGRYLSGKN